MSSVQAEYLLWPGKPTTSSLVQVETEVSPGRISSLPNRSQSLYYVIYFTSNTSSCAKSECEKICKSATCEELMKRSRHNVPQATLKRETNFAK